MATTLSAPVIRPIQFRSLIALLNPAEIKSFINNVNPEIVIAALSSYFIHGARASSKERMEHNDICNGVVSSIIESRKHRPVHPVLFQLDALPSGLIGACGSYLDQMSYARLSTANRDIYLALNTPGTLRQITVPYLSPAAYNMLHCSAISNANTLSFGPYGIDDKESGMSLNGMHVIASQIAKMSRLHSLELCTINSEFIGIIANHETTNQRINSLSVCLWSGDDAVQNRFISSITAFKHIQYLSLRGLREYPPLADDSKTKRLIEMCGDLKGLDFFDGEDYDGSVVEISLLRALGHRLHYLRINMFNSYQIATLKNIDFANLQQLQLGHYKIGSSVQAILNTAINLEKVSFDNDYGYKPELIVETMTKCKRLRYLEVKRMGDMEGILDAVGRGLFETKTLRRDTLKIRINTIASWQGNPIPKAQECVMKLDCIVNSLSINRVDQWMIVLDLSGDHKEFVECLLGSLTEDIATTHAIQIQNVGPKPDRLARQCNHIVLITNPGCTICGWRESWIMGSE